MQTLMFSAALVLTLASVNAKADCAMESDSVLPLTASKVPLNFKMVFSTANFNETRTHAVLVLKSKNETIALKSTLLIEGFSVLQFVLVPEKPLKEKTTYQLLKVKTKEVLATYETTSALDTEAPAPLPLMVKSERRYQEYGCGPARWAKFKFESKPTSEFVSLELTAPSKKVKTFIQATSDELLIGHTMCSGNFSLNEKGKYSLTVVPIDEAHNKGPASPPIEFERPDTMDSK